MSGLVFPDTPSNGDYYAGYVYTTAIGGGVWKKNDAAGGHLLGVAYPWFAAIVPDWGLELNGQAVSRTTYSGLFALWGTTYGVGNGTTTFNVPDLSNGRVPVGFGSAPFNVLGAVGGEQTHVLTKAETPNLPIYIRRMDGDVNDYLGGSGAAYGIASPYTTGGIDYNIAYTGGGDAAHNNMPPYLVAKWIVCAATSSGDFDTVVQAALVARVGATETSLDKGMLRRIVPSSVSVSSGSASVGSNGRVTMTNCDELFLNGVFSAGKNYKILIRPKVSTGSNNYFYTRLSSSGVRYTGSASDFSAMYSQAATYGNFASGTNVQHCTINYLSGSVNTIEIDINNPADAVYSTAKYDSNYDSTRVIGAWNMHVASAFDGIMFYGAGGTARFSGTAEVYEYA